MNRLLLTLALCAAATAAHAQSRSTPCNAATPANALCLMWEAPANHTDGTPIVLPISYRVEQKVGATWNAVQTVSVTRAYITGLTPGTYTYRVFAIVATKESAPSSEAARTLEQAPPMAPVLIIAATLKADGTWSSRIVYTVRPLEGEVVFTAPESARKLFAAK